MFQDLHIGAFVPEQFAVYRPLLVYGIHEFVRQLPPHRQAEIFTAQLSLPETASAPERLMALLRCSPALHKIGQVLARRHELDPELRRQLQELETLLPCAPVESYRRQIDDALGDSIPHYDMKFSDRALAEGSVAVVVPFTWKDDAAPEPAHGVLKLLKTGVVERVAEDINAVREVDRQLHGDSDRFAIPMDAVHSAIDDAAEILESEIDPAGEQRHLARAAKQLGGEANLIVPRLLPMCTSQITAMSRLHGTKITSAPANAIGRRRIARLTVRALLAEPMFSMEEPAIIHGDPHAGNLLAMEEGRVGVLDWSLAGELRCPQRQHLVQILLGGATGNSLRICRAIESLATGPVNERALLRSVQRSLSQLSLRLPDLDWLIGLLDDAARLGVRFDRNLMIFRKALFTLEGVVKDLDDQFQINETLAITAMSHLMSEWPSRCAVPPHSRNLGSKVSTNDLLDLAASLPLRALRWWMEQFARTISQV